MQTAVLSQSALTLRPSVFAELNPRIKALGDRCLPLRAVCQAVDIIQRVGMRD